MVSKSGTIRLELLVLVLFVMIFSFKQFFAALVQSDRFVFGFVEYESQQSMQAAIEVSLLSSSYHWLFVPVSLLSWTLPVAIPEYMYYCIRFTECVDSAAGCVFQITAECFCAYDYSFDCDIVTWYLLYNGCDNLLLFCNFYLSLQASPIHMEEKEVQIEAKRTNSRGRQSTWSE